MLKNKNYFSTQLDAVLCVATAAPGGAERCTGQARLISEHRGKPLAPSSWHLGYVLGFGEEELVSAQDAAHQQDSGCPQAVAIKQLGALHGAGRDPWAVFRFDSTQIRKLSIPPFKHNMAN